NQRAPDSSTRNNPFGAFSTLRLHPRTRQTLAALLACVSSCAFFNVARAQTRGDNYDATARSQSAPKQAEPKHDTQKQGAQKKTDADAARRAREVREAVAALREVADAARSFDDLYESTRAQSDAADVLWPYDEQAARAVLRRAWEAVTAPGVDEKVHGGVPSEIPGEGMSDELTEERRLIIEAAVKHDRRLADT